ncbi:MAG: hypothetical protein ACRCTZ_08345 [Sarcina sp.]
MEFNKDKADLFFNYWSAFYQLIKNNDDFFKGLNNESEYNLILSMESKYNYEVSLRLNNKIIVKIIYEKNSFKKDRNRGILSIKQIVDKSEADCTRKVKRTFNADNWDDAFLVLFQQLMYHPSIKSPEDVKSLYISIKRKVDGEKWEEPKCHNVAF